MMSLSDDKQADIIDGMINRNIIYFDNMVSHIYPSEL